MKNHMIQNPELMMAKHGKSFYFASQVFSKDVFIRISYLYAFCRFVDDTADEQSTELALKDLNSINMLLNSDQLVENPAIQNLEANITPHKTTESNVIINSEAYTRQSEISVSDLIQKLLSFALKKSYLQVLVDGALFDVQSQKITNLKDFLRYCYHVAGVVGLMMCPLIFVFQKKAYAFAIDLGIGMQITNICRDVLEDAENNRTYLPLDDLKKAGLTIENLKSKGQTPKALKILVKNQLDLADIYYNSSFQGFAYIPLRPRIAILFASDIYRSIGKKIRRMDYDVLKGRVYLSKTEKVITSIKSLFKILLPRFWIPGKHNSQLHRLLSGLPEVVL